VQAPRRIGRRAGPVHAAERALAGARLEIARRLAGLEPDGRIAAMAAALEHGHQNPPVLRESHALSAPASNAPGSSEMTNPHPEATMAPARVRRKRRWATIS